MAGVVIERKEVSAACQQLLFSLFELWQVRLAGPHHCRIVSKVQRVCYPANLELHVDIRGIDVCKTVMAMQHQHKKLLVKLCDNGELQHVKSCTITRLPEVPVNMTPAQLEHIKQMYLQRCLESLAGPSGLIWLS